MLQWNLIILTLAVLSPLVWCQFGVNYTGIAKPFDGKHGRGGKCSLDQPTLTGQPQAVVALNSVQYGGSAMCGACVRIYADGKQTLARVVDQCESCSYPDLKLSREAFQRLAKSSGKGKDDKDSKKNKTPRGLNVNWAFVPCPVHGPLVFKVKKNTPEQLVYIQVRNHRRPVETLAVNGQYLRRTSDNYFVGLQLGKGPFEVRVMSDNGQLIVDQIQSKAGIQRGHGQFKA